MTAKRKVQSLSKSQPEPRRPHQTPKPPDGGWGWIVVLSSFMIHVVADGVTYTFGIFYVELVKYFASSKGLTAWVPSIMTGVTYGIGPIASALTNKYGCRGVTIVGALMASLGLILSLFATSVTTLFFTVGICAGAGFGLIYLPAIVSVTCYFEKRRAFATGIAVCGSGIGSAMFAPFTEWLIQVYGWKGAMLIISGLILNCCVFGALLRPLEANDSDNRGISSQEEGKERKPLNYKATANGINGLRLSNGNCPETVSIMSDSPCPEMPPSSPSRHSFCAFKLTGEDAGHDRSVSGFDLHQDFCNNPLLEPQQPPEPQQPITGAGGDPPPLGREKERKHSASSGILYRKDIFYSRSLNTLPQYRSNPILYGESMSSINQFKAETKDNAICFCLSREMQDTFREMMDFAILKDPVFLIFAISNFITSLGYYVPHIYIKDRAIDLNIATHQEASMLLAIIGIGSTIGRVVFGYLSDHAFMNRLWLYNSCLTLCGLSTIFSSFARTYVLMALYSALFGLTCGAYVSLTSVILVDLLGLEKLTNAFGILLLFQGVACLMGPPIIGWTYDVTNSYDPGFHLAGAMIALSGLMLFFIPYIQRISKREHEAQSKLPIVLIGSKFEHN